MFALVADGKNGMRVIQLISPDTVPEAAGFDPKPNPHLIATFPVNDGMALAISRGLDRDRVWTKAATRPSFLVAVARVRFILMRWRNSSSTPTASSSA